MSSQFLQTPEAYTDIIRRIRHPPFSAVPNMCKKKAEISKTTMFNVLHRIKYSSKYTALCTGQKFAESEKWFQNNINNKCGYQQRQKATDMGCS